MSYEYSLVGCYPFADPEAEALARVADVLGVAVQTDAAGDRQIFTDGLLVVASVNDTEDEELSVKYFGFRSNLTLVFGDYSDGDGDQMIRLNQSILKAALSFAAVPGFRGALIVDYTDNTYLARVADGRLTLNKRYWDAWKASSEVLAVLPEPHDFEDLRLNT
jgi:hypothetical protein